MTHPPEIVDAIAGGGLGDWLRDFDQALKDIQSTQPKDTP